MPEQATLEEFDGQDATDDDVPDDGNRCTAIADYTGERCKRKSVPGLDVCTDHFDETEIALDATDDDATDNRARAGGDQRQ